MDLFFQNLPNCGEVTCLQAFRLEAQVEGPS
jgi:hypothetical protein